MTHGKLICEQQCKIPVFPVGIKMQFVFLISETVKDSVSIWQHCTNNNVVLKETKMRELETFYKKSLTRVIDIPAGSGQGCASAGAEGQVSVSRWLHLHVAAFSVLAGQAGRISDGGVWVLTI